MGYTTKISDYELARGDGPEPCEGVDIEAERENAEKSERKSKVVEPVKENAPKATTRTSVKDAKSK